MFSKELFRRWTYQVFAPGVLLREKYNAFRELLRFDDACLEGIAAIEDIHDGVRMVDWAGVVHLTGRLRTSVGEMAARLARLAPGRYLDLPEYAKKVDFYVQMAMDVPLGETGPPFVLPLAEVAGQAGLAGGKAANLARAALVKEVRVPEGFVVTTNAFRYFLEAAALRPKIDRLLGRVNLSRPDELAETAAALRRLLLSAPVPDEVAGPLAEAAKALSRGPNGTPRKLAARSSAVAEDGRASFAGQYESLLHVSPDEAVAAYQRVVAGKYTARAITYRVLTGFADAETPMAVLYLPMVEATASGVLHTRDGQGPAAPMTVHVVPGLGAALMAGTVSAERLALARTPPHAILPPPEPGDCELLSPAAARELAAQGLALEAAFGGPQEVEWVLPPTGGPVVVQSRPLAEDVPRIRDDAASVPVGVEPLLTGGQRAAGGRGAGIVRFASTVLDVEAIASGTVLVTPTLPTALTRVVDRLAAVVAVSGSRAGHFASVAREFGLPVVTGLSQAFGYLTEGQEVTVDAEAGAIYPGRLEALLGRAASARPDGGSPVATRLARLRPLVARLTLTDPASPDFAPAKVQSLHDIVRFAHEKAVAEMFSLVGDAGRGLGSAKKLNSDLPFALYVLDLGDGLFPDAARQAAVRLDDIRSAPLWALLSGLSAEDAPWPPGPPVTDDEALDRTSAGLFATSARQLASHAVIADTYAHVMLRFGYHFTVVDTLCGPDEDQNYIRLRFMGGGAGPEGRGSRLECLDRVLNHFGFAVHVTGDLLDATLARQPEGLTQRRLAMLGCLLAATRMLDLRLAPGDVEAWVEGFLASTIRRSRA